ncbi:hypothetical protein [Roseovarius nanhaiticus]|uniref:Uncharacterized protein n=1 Tax=Roseovarius nanhaiticus TaxID=573024 RepID=A0A1N7GAB5_9RHOB|nr:hypothetical protein [Roseovarius nanhaiticus]SEK32917.1 hypothetical protein SAMN05216208_0309 [Roseovarius nanhaiticus]SIS09472.1 hypothetical protein SAMN05421666_1827 [Roseovarius nanhaiticus]
MRQYAIPHSSPICAARHARLFELIRQQGRARRILARIMAEPEPDPATLAAVARRAAASWQKLR